MGQYSPQVDQRGNTAVPAHREIQQNTVNFEALQLPDKISDPKHPTSQMAQYNNPKVKTKNTDTDAQILVANDKFDKLIDQAINRIPAKNHLPQ